MLKIFKDCFSVNLNEYDNIRVNLEINKVILVAFFVLIIGIILFNSYRRNIRLAVSQLIRHGAKTQENAKTVGELGLGNVAPIKRMLLGENLLTRIVARVGDRRYEYDEYKALTKEEKEKISTGDFATARFYIREDKLYLAEEVTARYESSLVNTVIACVFVAIVCVCLIACMPGILNVINNALSA